MYDGAPDDANPDNAETTTDRSRLMSDYEVTLVNDNSETRPDPVRRPC